LIDRIYTQQWIALIVGTFFLFISIYAIFRGKRRDKIISISIFSICLIVYVLDEFKIQSHNSKADKYLGVHELVRYNNSNDYKIEIFPDNKYQVFNSKDTLPMGTWEVHVSNDNSTLLILSGGVFGVSEYKIK